MFSSPSPTELCWKTMSDVNCTSSSRNDSNLDVNTIKYFTYRIWLPCIVALGILGNILNLLTLRSPTLQNVPFMYIRAIAVFDMACLPLVGLACSRLWQTEAAFGYSMTFYQAHVERALINVLLTASLFTALMLTVERYYLICRPYKVRRIKIAHPRVAAKFYILCCAVSSTLLHVPMLFEKTPVCSDEDKLCCTVKDNVKLPKRLLKASKLAREIVCRILPVFFLAVLNVVIVRSLQKLKIRRRQMTMKLSSLHVVDIHSDTTPTSSSTASRKNKRRTSSFLGSFTEKRLTTMMVAITVVYVVGNVPQSISMILNEDSRINDFAFQLFRAFANSLEICHHCLNFYVFCLTSRDYWKSFLRHGRWAKRYVLVSLFRRILVRRSSVEPEATSFKPPGELSVLLFHEEEFVFVE